MFGRIGSRWADYVCTKTRGLEENLRLWSFWTGCLISASILEVSRREQAGREKSRHTDRCVYSRQRKKCVDNPPWEGVWFDSQQACLSWCCVYENSLFGHIVHSVYCKKQMHTKMHPATFKAPNLTSTFTYLPTMTPLHLLAVGNKNAHKYSLTDIIYTILR